MNKIKGNNRCYGRFQRQHSLSGHHSMMASASCSTYCHMNYHYSLTGERNYCRSNNYNGACCLSGKQYAVQNDDMLPECSGKRLY